MLDLILRDSRFRGWKGYMDGGWAYLESPHAAITRDDMNAMQAWYVDQIGCMTREELGPGVFMRFRILDPRD